MTVNCVHIQTYHGELLTFMNGSFFKIARSLQRCSVTSVSSSSKIKSTHLPTSDEGNLTLVG